MQTPVKFIDATPTWQQLLPLLIEVASNGDTSKARQNALNELMRLAKTVDDINMALKVETS